MKTIGKQLSDIGLIPIITLENALDARPLARALLAADIPVVEFTFRSGACLEAIQILNDEFPQMIVGAGTVLTPEQARQAANAGARFLLSPGFNPGVVSCCLDEGITIIPGVCTPTQVELALETGLDTLKFFPAEASGGVDYLESMAAPFPGTRFVATGGIRNENLADYFASSFIAACGGSWIADRMLVAEGRFDEITRRAKEAVRTMLGIRLECILLPDKDDGNSLPGTLFSDIIDTPLVRLDSQTRDAVSVSTGENLYDPLFSPDNEKTTDYGTIIFSTPDAGKVALFMERRGIACERGGEDRFSGAPFLRLKGSYAGHSVIFVERKRPMYGSVKPGQTSLTHP